ncbi:MAG: hypothetical protein U5L96_11310 [Owenweeksia sp.]|nr:hypothetical protein [Owenweeksia sp.]
MASAIYRAFRDYREERQKMEDQQITTPRPQAGQTGQPVLENQNPPNPELPGEGKDNEASTSVFFGADSHQHQ